MVLAKNIRQFWPNTFDPKHAKSCKVVFGSDLAPKKIDPDVRVEPWIEGRQGYEQQKAFYPGADHGEATESQSCATCPLYVIKM